MKFSFSDIQALCEPDGGHLRSKDKDDSYRFCRRLALGHYENFPVGSVLIPRHLQADFYSIYAFARIADDIADEPYPISHNERITLLNSFRSLLRYGTKDHPIFSGLHRTITAYQIPHDPFERLISAFQQDCTFTPFTTWHDADDYCSRSANPIGELILRLYGLWNEQCEPYSNALCTGLQYTNFWQDFSRDLPTGRCYIPQSELLHVGLTIVDIHELYEYLGKHQKTSNFKGVFGVIRDDADHFHQLSTCLHKIVNHTKHYLHLGTRLLEHIPSIRLRMELAITVGGGLTILRQTQTLGNRILIERPKLGMLHKVSLLADALRMVMSPIVTPLSSSSIGT